jgi:hypothetical protein
MDGPHPDVPWSCAIVGVGLFVNQGPCAYIHAQTRICTWKPVVFDACTSASNFHIGPVTCVIHYLLL